VTPKERANLTAIAAGMRRELATLETLLALHVKDAGQVEVLKATSGVHGVIATVATFYGLTAETLLATARHDEVAIPRRIAAYCAGKVYPALTDEQLSLAFHRERSWVSWAQRRVAGEMAEPSFAAEVNEFPSTACRACSYRSALVPGPKMNPASYPR